MTVDEALEHKTYLQAIAGNQKARREVLKMIVAREKALGAGPRPADPLSKWMRRSSRS